LYGFSGKEKSVDFYFNLPKCCRFGAEFKRLLNNSFFWLKGEGGKVGARVSLAMKPYLLQTIASKLRLKFTTTEVADPV
jgi:hypothetical protein